MKKFAILLVCFMFVGMIMADELDKLQEAHKNAMKFHGRADLMTRGAGKMVFMSTAKGKMVSAYLDKELCTFYAEDQDKKFYVEWKLIPGGIEITFHVNILGHEIVKTVTILFNNDSLVIKGSAGDEKYDWWCLVKCVGGKIFECISCGTDWKCWGTCAGADVVSCVMGCF